MIAMYSLKQLREELGIIQEDMAQAIGIRANTYSRIERGKNVSYSTAQKILKFLNQERAKINLSQIERVEDLGLSIV